MLAATSIWEKETCLTFVEGSSVSDYLLFTDGSGYVSKKNNAKTLKKSIRCRSHFGQVGGPQKIWLDSSACMYNGIGVHELGHAIAFLHEQSNPIRDNYVEIHSERMNAIRELLEKHNFRTSPHFPEGYNSNTTYDGQKSDSYDLGSIMHYSRFVS